MKKHAFVFIVLLLTIAGGVYAQTNWVSTEINLLGAGARYEYVIVPEFTVSAYAYWSYSPYILIYSGSYSDSFGFGAAARWYPFGRRFFTELGLGYTYQYLTNSNFEYDNSWVNSGFTILPGFGWTIDVGEKGGFFISPSVRVPFIFGARYFLDNFGGTLISIGLGYAF
jgi:hypothetical protein